MVPLRPLLTPDASLGTIDLPVLRQTIRTHRPPPPAGVAAGGNSRSGLRPRTPGSAASLTAPSVRRGPWACDAIGAGRATRSVGLRRNPRRARAGTRAGPAAEPVAGLRRFPSSASARIWLDSSVLTRTSPRSAALGRGRPGTVEGTNDDVAHARRDRSPGPRLDGVPVVWLRARRHGARGRGRALHLGR